MRRPVRYNLRLVGCALLLVLGGNALAGQVRVSAEEGTLWTERRYSVVLGTMSQVKKDPSSPTLHAAVLTPVATIAGTFDCGAHATLPVTFYVDPTGGGAGSSIAVAPHDGDAVMVVLQYLPKGKESPADSGFIVSDACTFMPEESALVMIRGPEDPLVRQTLNRIQRDRNPGAAAPAASQPSRSAKQQ